MIFLEDFANKERGCSLSPTVTWLGGAALGFWSQNVIETLLAFKTDLHVLSE